MSSFASRIAGLLIDQGVASKEQLDSLLAEAADSRKNFARILIDRNIVSETKLTELLAGELGLPLISVAKYRIDPAVATLIPERLARQYNVLALAKLGEHLVVAMSDPMNIFAIDDLKALTQTGINPVLCSETEIREAIEKVYAPDRAAQEHKALTDLAEVTKVESLETAVDLLLDETGENEAPVVRVINLVVAEAIRLQASDIHIEPLPKSLRVRYRVDGRLMDAHRLPKTVQGPLLTRLKIMAGLDITEWRLPQDGRFKARMQGREVDFRVSVLPIAHGGKIVLRVLDKSSLSLGLEHLGFLTDSINLFKSAVSRPYGMVLVTGPTGSGKSTTLYSILNGFNRAARNLITIEDPVEYQIEGITQVQTNPDVGLSFASGLRALLRQSPDVVMIGEIRDFETADIAMKASLTGQLVLSTLHTNDAASAVTRLIDMGVEPFLVASSVSIIEAQRLVRKLCGKCRQPIKPDPSVLEQLGLTPSKGDTYFRSSGCPQCNGKGYRGRLAIVELCLVDDRVRELIVSRAQSWEIKDYAIKRLKMVPLRQDGLRKAALGLTTLEEVLAVTAEE
ncbi:MAG TPA: ATPase, T2SS/T4P/T4SS family [bacterium]